MTDAIEHMHVQADVAPDVARKAIATVEKMVPVEEAPIMLDMLGLVPA